MALDRRTELVPNTTGVLIETFLRYTELEQPTDYTVNYEPDLRLQL